MSTGMRVVIGVFLIILLAFGWLSIKGKRIQKELAKKYPPPGQLVDIGDFRLHLNCQGCAQGACNPTVVMEAADFSTTWALVQPEVAKFARVCTYDRAGLGWSDKSPNPRTAGNIVHELHILLQEAQIDPPYVMVGHSKGGLFVRLYAQQYPDQVAGIVLVDAAHEEQEMRFPESITNLNRIGRRRTISLLAVVKRLNSFGLLTPILKQASDQLLRMVPENAREMSLAVSISDKFIETTIEETNNLEQHFAEVQAAQISDFGKIPLIVLTAVDQFSSLEKQVSTDDLERLQTVVMELQAALSRLSTNGKLVEVEGAGHYIQVDRPQLVIDAIREVVDLTHP